MAGEKSGDNKVFQLLTLIITTIVAPITVFLVTNGLKASNPPPTPVPMVVAAQNITATSEVPTLTMTALLTETVGLPAELTLTPEWTATASSTAAQPLPTETPLPPTSTSTFTPEPSPTSYGVQNPTGLIPAGTPAVVNALALVVESDDVVMEGNYLRLNLVVRNLSENRQSFSFKVKSIKVKDDTGKVYEPFIGEKKPACKPNDLEVEKIVQVEPGKDVTIRSAPVKDFGDWCGRNAAELLPIYLGPVSEKAESLRIELDGFGPFSGFVVEVDLK